MPIYDRVCPDGHQLLECYERISHADPVLCKTCGKETKREILSRKTAIIGDDIPGGIDIRHGLCNEDGSPRRYYSKSEIAAEAKRRGLVNRVEHVTDPRTGSDKNPHTIRWDGLPSGLATTVEERRQSMAAFLGLTLAEYEERYC